MRNQNMRSNSIVWAFALPLMCVLTATAAQAQTLPGFGLRPGGPIRGLDVKLGKNPGGQAAARAATADSSGAKICASDDDGAFDFGVLPAGEYELIPAFPAETSSGRGVKTTRSNIKIIRIKLTGVVGGTVERDWDFETSKVWEVNSETSPAGRVSITFQADGKSVVRGTAHEMASGTIQNVR